MSDLGQYIGDGLYLRAASWGEIVLTAPRAGGNHEVYLEPEVLRALLAHLDAAGLLPEPYRAKK